MAFASQKWRPSKFELASAIAEALTNGAALPLELGGTGVIAAGADDAARSLDVLNTWGITSGGIIVPARLPVMGGASSGSPGVVGAVGAPAAGSQSRAWRGDASFATELELTSIVKADLTKVFDFENLGDAANRFYAVAPSSGGRKARLGTRSTVDVDIDAQLEPKGRGRVTQWGDPLQTTIKPLRCITAESRSVAGVATVFHTLGLPTPTIQTPGAAAVSLLDGNGSYCSLTYDKDIPSPSGLIVGDCTRRGWFPSLLMVFRVAAANSRFWFGLFNGDPVGLDDIAAAGIKGAGVRVGPGDSNTLQFITSDGVTQTTTSTGYTVPANTFQVWRVRFLDGTQGWEFSQWDLATQAWSNFTLSSTNMPGSTDALGIYVRLSEATTPANRAVSIKTIQLNAN